MNVEGPSTSAAKHIIIIIAKQLSDTNSALEMFTIIRHENLHFTYLHTYLQVTACLGGGSTGDYFDKKV